MKIKTPIFVLLVALLGGSLLNAGSVIAQSGPNNNFATGDNFYFNSDSTRNDNWLSRTVLANDADPSQLYRYEEHSNANDETVDGDLELFLIKPSTNLPPFYHPDTGNFDHLLMVEWNGITVDPSSRTWEDKFFDAGAGGVWQNSTPQVEDTTGRHQDDGKDSDDENSQPVISNSTYLLLLSEITDDSYGVDFLDWMQPGTNLGTFDQNIPLVDRYVTLETGRTYNINGADIPINTRNVFSNFEITWFETFNTSLNFGDPNDPNADTVDVEANVDIIVNYNFEHYFDQSNGMLLEIVEEKSFNINLTYYNASTTNPHNDPGCTIDCGPTTMSFELFTSGIGSSSQHSTIETASSFYGNDRPMSSGNNRIEEGQALVYLQDSESSFSLDTETKAGDSFTTGYEKFDSRSGSFNADGTATFDVYRHEPGMFDTVMVMEGQRSGEQTWSSSGTRGGTTENDGGTFTNDPEDYIQFEYMSFLSTPSEEIQHFFDDSMHFNDDFLYDDGDDNDGWRLNYNRDVPKIGAEVHLTEHMDLEAGEDVDINGFLHTWFSVESFGQKYERSYDEAVQIPIERDRDNGDQWINVQLTGTATGEQTFFYDEDTGVLVHMEQMTEATLLLEGSGVISIVVREEGLPDVDVELNVNFKANIQLFEKWSITLSDHPVEYKSAQGADPVDHSTDTTTTDDETTSESAGLPLPVPIIPVLSGLGIITLIIRKRKN